MKKVKPKILKNQFLNGSMLVQLALSYASALNTGKIPTIENAWSNVQTGELQKSLKEGIQQSEYQLKEKIEKNLPMKEVDIKVIGKTIK